ncbi:MAG TPA: TonB-dependent receptor, partial [Longimicrobiales bacterium]|nr:TonB-dependent receptor [Longimicrobiales bacterium]
MVTVSRTRIPLAENPAATMVVSRQDMREMPRTVAVDEAVRLVPGVKVDNQADGERVHMSIRGQGILSEHGLRGIKVLQDGIPLNDPTGFAPDLYDVDWSNVERIEVLRGPGASLYGGGATAGVLNIITAPAGTGPSMVAEGHAGSNGFWKTNARSSGQVGGVGYEVSLSRAMGDGYRVHTQFAATNLYAKGDIRPSDRLEIRPIVAWTGFFNENAEGLNLTWLAQDRKQANPDALTFNELQRTQRFTGGFTGSWRADAATSLDFNAYLHSTRYKEPVPSSVPHRSLVGPGATLQLTHHTATGAVRHTLAGGADVQWQTIDEYRHPNLGLAMEGPELLSDETIQQSGLGIFLLDQLDFGRGWSGTVNVRYDRITNQLTDHLAADGVDLSGDANFDHSTARVGLAYSPTTTFSVYANWGQGFLPPATEELASNPAAQGGFNASLTPALSHGEEVGVRGMLGRRLFYDVALFHLDTHGDFDRYRIDTRPLETFYRNGGNSRRFGTELYANWSPVNAVRLEAAYTWSHFIYRESQSFYGDITGHWLPNSP